MIRPIRRFSSNKNFAGKSGKTNTSLYSLTVERFLKDGYYYLFTASLFDSKYKGGDGKEYSTRFNRGQVVNLLAGKEWVVRNKYIISTKVTYMGGLRYTPAVYVESIAARMYKPDNSQWEASMYRIFIRHRAVGLDICPEKFQIKNPG